MTSVTRFHRYKAKESFARVEKEVQNGSKHTVDRGARRQSIPTDDASRAALEATVLPEQRVSRRCSAAAPVPGSAWRFSFPTRSGLKRRVQSASF